ncbi:MAG: carboxypeptidase regulatory-like domain-containing protein [Acidobacteriia bacterium]|nr:carboxypeptidase regulatory-like domain-containing protein [Terriglobia bacterium]
MVSERSRIESGSRRSLLLLGNVILMFSMATLWGQEPTAAITGTVQDTSGAAVPRASVTLTAVGTGKTRALVTDERGNYSALSIPVGRYEVRVEKAGFKAFVRTGVTLEVANQTIVDVRLEVGDVQQTMTVTGEAPLVNTTVAATSGLVGERQVKDLPLNGRSFDQLLTLNTGTSNYTNNYHSGVQGNAFSVAGRRPEENRFLMNGVDYIGTDDSGQIVLPSGASGLLLGVDAVLEFNVLQDSYGAQYGKRAGGQVTIVTSSGTNQLHGDVFEFFRNSALDARNFFDHSVGPSPFKRNQFGGALGGPIKKDKLFLFGNYEGFRQRLGLSNVAVVPDANARQGLLPIGPGGAEVPVPGLQPKMLPFFAYWPTPNGPTLGGGLALNFSNPPQRIREDFGLTRLDYSMSANDSLSASYTLDDGENDTPQADPVFLTSTIQRTQLLSVQETHVFSPTILNTTTFGFSRAFALSQTPTNVPIPPSLWLISATAPGAISIGGGVVSTVAAAVTSPAGTRTTRNARNLFTGSDDVHFTRGGHSISAGVWIQRVQQNLSGAHLALSGSVSYPSLTAFLQDKPTSFVATPNPTPLGHRSTEAAGYIEDDIKLKPNLTIRIGLRDEMTTGWNEVSGRAANYLFDTQGMILTDPLVGDSIFTQNHAHALWQPRLGVAWDPTGTGRWSVRAGFGIYNDLQDSLAHRISANPPFNARMSISNTPMLSIIPIPGGTQPPPSCNAQLQAAKTPCSIFSPGGVDPEMRTPTVQEWSLTLEREITRNLKFLVGYVGSEAYHTSLSIDRNVAPPQICSAPAGCASGGVGSAVATVPQGTLYMPPGMRPNPFVANTFSWLFQGTSNYHALNVSVVKRASSGLSFKVNYTFSKIMDLNSAITNSSGQNEPQSILNPFNFALNRGVSAYSLKHQFNTHFTYELPIGRGRSLGGNASRFVEELIGGWQWNGIITAQSGFPFTPQVGANVSGTGDTFNPDVPNWNPAFSGPVIPGTPDHWFDPRAFTRPLPGTFGNVARGSLIGPGLFTIDTSLFKEFSMGEKLTLQFRAETFNLLNHANFGIPSQVVFSGTNIANSAGVVTSTATTSRQMQLALKLIF